MYNDKLVYKVLIWVFFAISLWEEKVALSWLFPDSMDNIINWLSLDSMGNTTFHQTLKSFVLRYMQEFVCELKWHVGILSHINFPLLYTCKCSLLLHFAERGFAPG